MSFDDFTKMGGNLADYTEYKMGGERRVKVILRNDTEPGARLNAQTAGVLAKKFDDPMDLKNFQKIGDSAKDAVAGSNRNPQFEKHWASLEEIIKTQPEALSGLADLYNKNPDRYAEALSGLAIQLNKHPAGAERKIAELKANPQAVGGLVEKYQNNRRAVVAELEGKPVAASPVNTTVTTGPAPAETKVTQAPTAKPAAGPKKPGAKAPAAQPSKAPAAAAAATAAGAAAGAAGAVTEQASEAVATQQVDYTADTATKRMDGFLADKKNERFAKALAEADPSIKTEMYAKLKRKPDSAAYLDDPDRVENMAAQLEKMKGKSGAELEKEKAGFLTAFGGPEKEGLPGLAGLGAGGLGGALKGLMGSLKDIPLIGPLISGVMGGIEKFMGIMGRMFDSVTGAGQVTAPKAENSPLYKMTRKMEQDGVFKDGAVTGQDKLAEMTKAARDGLRGTPAERQATSQMLREGGLSQGEVYALMGDPGNKAIGVKGDEGQARFKLVQVTKDPQTGKEKLGFEIESTNIKTAMNEAVPQAAAPKENAPQPIAQTPRPEIEMVPTPPLVTSAG